MEWLKKIFSKVVGKPQDFKYEVGMHIVFIDPKLYGTYGLTGIITSRHTSEDFGTARYFNYYGVNFGSSIYFTEEKRLELVSYEKSRVMKALRGK